MTPRLSKRQQREQDELLALASSKPSHASLTSSDLRESDAEEVVDAPAKSGFAALFTPEDEPDLAESEEEDIAKPTKSRKKKKKKAAPAHDEVPPDHPSTTKPGAPRSQPSAQTKTTSKKGKGKDKKDDKDDLDKALAELSVKYPELQHVASSTTTDTRTTALSSLLSVSVSHLDAESELKKFFGSKAVSAAQSTTSTPSPYKKRRGVQPQTQRSQLTRPQPSWGMIKQREGLSSRPLTEEEATRKVSKGPAGSGKWWTVEYGKRYKGVTKTFMQAVMTGDPETLWGVLQRMPWHADTLLQLAEVYRHREEYSQAVDYVSRALYAYERAFLGAFSFTSGNNRLDFDRVENRPFFLAVHRQVIDLQRRGCPRTAFEHARLLLSLEPLTDPHGVLLHLDYLSVKAGMGDWLLDVWKVYQGRSSGDSDEYLDPSALPGWAYARAMLLKAKEKGKKDRGESTQALRQAILAFPSIVPLLADKCDISLSAEVRKHKAFRIHTDSSGLSSAESVLHLLSHLYAQRSSPLWKSSAQASWLSSTTTSLLSLLSTQRTHPTRDRFLRTFSSLTLRQSIYRHIFVLEQTHAQPQNRALTAFIPSDITQGRQLACDPLPPPTAISTYDAAFFAGAEDPFTPRVRTGRRTQAEERLLARLIPDAATRGQIVAFFDQNPGLAAQVPGGIVQFVQMMGEMPEDALQDLMLGAAMMREGGGAGGVQPGLAERGLMPGQLMDEEIEVFWDAEGGEDEDGGGDVDDVPHPQMEQPDNDDDNDDGEDEEEDIAPMPLRVVRNLINRLWGGGAEEESSDDEGSERDHDGVD
ncbi:hypothetical protein PAXINDRAFT_82129 [Paxillus involutus ATCC 200175]|uniref:DUF654-domain-containing protein n=1 Tax=Paxillus involutus ATCC 200175 TaxID=664439 RepID=A0A0C9TQX3_PAXIN|nr:hypothetical protein PAXINDRAFT_82129 [Paxillus involutus ATCC 200175]